MKSLLKILSFPLTFTMYSFILYIEDNDNVCLDASARGT